jgi:hypothetical protein
VQNLESIPHPRTAASTLDVRDLPSEQDVTGNHLFAVPSPTRILSAKPLSSIPLHARTPPIPGRRLGVRASAPGTG